MTTRIPVSFDDVSSTYIYYPATIWWPGIFLTCARTVTALVHYPDVLAKYLQTINVKYGSMATFLAQEMELVPKKLATLRSKYLNWLGECRRYINQYESVGKLSALVGHRADSYWFIYILM